jgi:hypothetical protein
VPRTTGFPCDPHERISVCRFNAVTVTTSARWTEQDAYDHNHKDSCHADPQDKPKSWHFHRIVSAANRPGTETNNVHAGMFARVCVLVHVFLVARRAAFPITRISLLTPAPGRA